VFEFTLLYSLFVVESFVIVVFVASSTQYYFSVVMLHAIKRSTRSHRHLKASMLRDAVSRGNRFRRRVSI